jgi:hypothetical protein
MNAEKIVKIPISIVVYSTWLVIGFLVYVPMLSRVVSVYSAMIIPSVLSGNRSSIERLSVMLNRAINFYPMGFKLITETLFSNQTEIPAGTRGENINIAKTIVELVFTIIFWFSILYIIHRH